jgi:hypothetical protein
MRPRKSAPARVAPARIVVTLLLALFSGALSASSIRAEDKEDKALAAAIDELEKDFKTKKEEPGQSLELLASLAAKIPPKDALGIVKDLLKKKAPITALLAFMLERGDETDSKKLAARLKSWVAEWNSPFTGPTVYVSTEGKDEGPGSQKAPWKTLNYAVRTAPAGSTIVLHEGTYSEWVSCRKPLAIHAFPKETVRLVPGSGATSGPITMEPQSDGSELVGLEIEGLKGHFVEVNSKDVLIDRCKIKGGLSLQPGAIRSVVSHCDVEGRGVVLWANFTILQDSHIHDVELGGGAELCNGVVRGLVQRNLLENVAEGIQVGQPVIMTGYDTTDCVARNNIVMKTKGAGITAAGSLRPVIANNTILEAAAERQGGIFITGFAHGKDKPRQKTKDPTVVNNVVVVGGLQPALELTADTEGDPHIANNCYFSTKGTPFFADGALEKPFKGEFESWKTQVPGGDAGSTVMPPGLEADHSPGPKSPCLHSGKALAGFLDDFSGHRRKSWDMGAVAPAEPPKK